MVPKMMCLVNDLVIFVLAYILIENTSKNLANYSWEFIDYL